MADYVLSNFKWGSSTLGTSGGTVTWSFAVANYASQHFQFDFSLSADFFADVRRAFAVWEAAANIHFVEVADASNVNIRLGLDYIDGASNTLGEAWTQFTAAGSAITSEIRFDTVASENWTSTANGVVSGSGTPFWLVALHEIGHTLGLGHYTGSVAVMNPLINSSLTGLTSSDLHGVQAIYGASGTTPPPPVPPPTFAGVLFIGGIGGDTIVGNSLANYIDGAGGNDYIGGGPGPDNLYGNDGNDRMDGHQDADYVSGDAGDDVIYGGDGSDVLVGGTGNDVLVGDIEGTTELGADVLYGGPGDDILYGGAGNDVLRGDDATGAQGADYLYGESGNDILLGFGGDDRLFGGVGFDVLFGDAGRDVLLGGADNDYLYGGDDTDVLLGEDGNDVLNGGAAPDYMVGGAGYDIFVLKPGEAKGDVIADFVNGGDMLSLQGYGAGAKLTNAGGGVFYVTYSGGIDTFVLNGVTSLVANADYVFA